VRLIDVRHLGRERVIGCWELDHVLIDPGPTSSMDNLIEALDGEQPRALLLTHIHLDHAGAAGSLVRRWPELPVYVHERATWPTRPSCWRAPSASTATRWSGSGERLRRCRRRT
jgi:glyoxylase-like metal-dependent hydrolase (beta-lactamase superfamily II)